MDKRHLVQELISHLEREGVVGLPTTWLSSSSRALGDDITTRLEQNTAGRVEQPEFTRSGGNAIGWSELEKQALSCTKCRLCETRNKVVFGVGRTISPDIVFVGEGPGADEDRQGLPFVGRAGMLLTAAITKGMGLTRDDVYICNIVKCRPPENRTPLPDEVEACKPYLVGQLSYLKPKVIVALGGQASIVMTGETIGITKLRGKWHEFEGIKVMPTFHPAYLLRNPSAKKEFWEDLKEVMRAVGLVPRAEMGAQGG